MTEKSSALRLSHIDIAVRNLEAARERFAILLDPSPSPVEEVVR